MDTQITYQDQSVGTQPLVKYWKKTANNTKYLFTGTKPDRHLGIILVVWEILCMSIWIFSFWSASKHLQGIKIYEISHQ